MEGVGSEGGEMCVCVCVWVCCVCGGGTRLNDCDCVFDLFILFGIDLSELPYCDDT